MKLVKWCHSEHHISTCTQLKLGSLAYFREMESVALRDTSEGTFDVEISHPSGVIIPQHLVSRILPSMVAVDGYQKSDISHKVTGHIPKIHFNGDHIKAIGPIRYRSSFHNALAFCMSAERDPKPTSFVDYLDNWEIDAESAPDFAKEIQRLVNDEYRESWLRPTKVENHIANNVSRARVVVRHQLVEYINRKIFAPYVNNIVVDEVERLLRNSPFIKGQQFKAEREYRFLVTMELDGHVLPCPLTTAFIPAEPFRKITNKSVRYW